MRIEEHHFGSKADAGASKTYRQQAGTIRKNGYIVIKGRPCKRFPPPRLENMGMLNVTLLPLIFSMLSNLKILSRHLITVMLLSHVNLLTENGNTKDDLRLPTDETLLAQPSFKF
ncbi:hypothetical protein C4D60_Mb06t24610 [Musa balbisiana]|uniref:Translation initiation factor 5A-like N-terminal domain-containing protein n=1 Tax=Musa balbisiana TaxID=52838 RepID=A0A4S8IQE5_MUSBA|nr:hypothetical protein C4D60_Mb06t24610 [Musa balbisiana]